MYSYGSTVLFRYNFSDIIVSECFLYGIFNVKTNVLSVLRLSVFIIVVIATIMGNKMTYPTKIKTTLN